MVITTSLVSSDIVSINAGGNKNIIINTDDYLEGFFTFTDIYTGEDWTIKEGRGILSMYFINYTLEKEPLVWLINEEAEVIINCYDNKDLLIDVNNIKVIFDEEYIESANLTRIDIGEYIIIFDIGNKIGETTLLFNIDNKEQTLVVNITEYKFNLFVFLREHVVVIVYITFLLLLLILIIVLTNKIKKYPEKEDNFN